jgi:hypothetical protein
MNVHTVLAFVAILATTLTILDIFFGGGDPR